MVPLLLLGTCNSVHMMSAKQFLGGKMPYKILVVDNEPTDLECTKIILEEDPDFQVTGFLDPDSAIKSIRENPHQYAVVLLDYRMPKDGIQVARNFGKLWTADKRNIAA